MARNHDIDIPIVGIYYAGKNSNRILSEQQFSRDIHKINVPVATFHIQDTLNVGIERTRVLLLLWYL